MAAFCKQCSVQTFGKDYGDMAHPEDPPLEPGYAYVELCEGCDNGQGIRVNKEGECLGINCTLEHKLPS